MLEGPPYFPHLLPACFTCFHLEEPPYFLHFSFHFALSLAYLHSVCKEGCIGCTHRTYTGPPVSSLNHGPPGSLNPGPSASLNQGPALSLPTEAPLAPDCPGTDNVCEHRQDTYPHNLGTVLYICSTFDKNAFYLSATHCDSP